jgi:hypothetical protein
VRAKRSYVERILDGAIVWGDRVSPGGQRDGPGAVHAARVVDRDRPRPPAKVDLPGAWKPGLGFCTLCCLVCMLESHE